jgi:hypothetical protein
VVITVRQQQAKACPHQRIDVANEKEKALAKHTGCTTQKKAQ